MDVTRWFAPGRINLIGEHTDYNDGFVLPFALEMGCVATVGGPAEGHADGWSLRSTRQPESVVVPRTGLAQAGEVPLWARYVCGALWLLHDRGVDVPPLAIEVESDVPPGAGLSSSAALVCSVVRAVEDHLGLGLDDDEVFHLTRAVENDAVGAPTGGMDQLVSLRGMSGHALLCDMRSLRTRPVPLALAQAGLRILVVDTFAPHRHSDGEYAARRRGCEQAARILGVPALRDVAGPGVEMPAALDDELRRYVRHVVTENGRVLEVARLLGEGRILEVGPVLTHSHASMRDDFRITVEEVDTAVEALLEAGALGARMTGGGFGGCVIALVSEEVLEVAEEAVRRAFSARGHRAPTTFVAAPAAGARPVPD